MDDKELQRRARVVANAFAKEYNKRLGIQIKVPLDIHFDLETNLDDAHPTCAGMAYSANDRIRFNMTMYRDRSALYWNQIIPHEVAHLAQAYVEQRRNIPHDAHGDVWEEMMRLMSRDPTPTYTIDPTKSIKAHNVLQALKERK